MRDTVLANQKRLAAWIEWKFVLGRVKNEEKRLEILEIAYDMFLEKGFENVKLTEIAKAADISPQLLRHFFGTTQDILVELVFNIAARMFSFVADHISLLDDVPDEDAPLVAIDVFYRLHYSTVGRDLALFNLYRAIMYDSRVKKREVDYIIMGMRTHFDSRFTGGPDWESGLHVACSAQSALVLRFAPDGLPTVSVNEILDGAMRAFCGYLGKGPDVCERVLKTTQGIITEDVKEEYRTYFYANIRDFFLLK